MTFLYKDIGFINLLIPHDTLTWKHLDSRTHYNNKSDRLNSEEYYMNKIPWHLLTASKWLLRNKITFAFLGLLFGILTTKLTADIF